jgi:hypothetical protein
MRGLRNVMRMAVIAMFAMMLALPAGALAQPAAGLIVTPGLGIGRWTVDTVLPEYIWATGDVDLLNGEAVPLSDVRPSGTDLVFQRQLLEKAWQTPDRIFVVYPPMSQMIWAVGTTEWGAQTIERVGVASTEDQIRGAYQAPEFVQQLPLRSRTLIYDGRGVAFEIPYNRASGQYGPGVGRVWVFRPGQAREIWRLP